MALAPNLHLQQLAYVREVGRQPTWAAAAIALNVSQPALSQALSEVERRLGVAIFEREGRRRRFTPDGEVLLAYARETLERTAQMVEASNAAVAAAPDACAWG